MIGATWDVGPNSITLAGMVIALATLWINTRKSERAAKAAESAAGQLVNNGGSSALDKIERGQREIMSEVHDLRAVVDQHTVELTKITAGE